MRVLRLQIIGILALVVILPLVPAIFTARALFRHSLDPMIQEETRKGLEAGLDCARRLLEIEKMQLSSMIQRGEALDTLTAAEIEGLDPRERAALAALERLSPPAGGIPVAPERVPLGGRELLVARTATADGGAAWVTRPVSRELVEWAVALTDSHRLLQAVRLEQGRYVRSLVATFVVVYGLLIVAVLGMGLYLASRATRPIAAMGDAIRRVSSGDLEARAPENAGGEIGSLLRSFNQMIIRLGTQKEELVRLERIAAWRQMARSLAHEIKNPLTPIQLAAQELRDAYEARDPAYPRLVQEATAIIEEEVRSLRALVSEFSQFARLPEPQPAPIAAGELLDEIRALYGPEKVSVRAEGSLPLWCDHDQIQRALLNLIENALAAQSESGRTDPIDVSAETTPAGARLRVEDRGPGVPPDRRRRIFEPNVTTKSGGMGLGLAIVESTIRAHGGTIAVADRDGGGAVFEFWLPSVPQDRSGGSE
jgi:nitrogen fixation/metabolism regulation signal transduction histidine kinase